MSTAALVLAAGAGTRFHGPTHKLLALWQGSPLVSWAIGHALAGGLDECVVVTGGVDLESGLPAGVTLVANPAWEGGLATSLQAGLAYAARAGHDAVAVGLGDQPGITPEAWARIGATRTSPIVVATYAGRPGHPVRLAAPTWELLPKVGELGARTLMAERPELVTQVACDGDPVDIDTAEDLNTWN